MQISRKIYYIAYFVIFVSISYILILFDIDLNSIISNVIIFAYIAAGFILITKVSIKDSRARDTQLQKVAKRFNLQFTPSINRFFWENGEVGGRYKGFRISCYACPANHESFITVIRFIIYLNNNINNNFEICSRRHDILTLGNYIKFSNPDFNSRYRVKSGNEAVTRAIIDDKIQEAFLGIESVFHGFIDLNNNELAYEHSRKLLKDEQRESFEHVINVLFLIANKIQDNPH